MYNLISIRTYIIIFSEKIKGYKDTPPNNLLLSR